MHTTFMLTTFDFQGFRLDRSSFPSESIQNSQFVSQLHASLKKLRFQEKKNRSSEKKTYLWLAQWAQDFSLKDSFVVFATSFFRILMKRYVESIAWISYKTSILHDWKQNKKTAKFFIQKDTTCLVSYFRSERVTLYFLKTKRNPIKLTENIILPVYITQILPNKKA